MLLLTDDRLMETMRSFVTASNRLRHLNGLVHVDVHAIDQAGAQQREAASLLQEALIERGWRRPGT